MTEKELMKKWFAAVKGTGFIAKGSIRQYKRNCGKKSCPKCASGERHLTYQMTYYKDGRQHSRYVGPTQIEEFRQAIANGRKLEELMVDFGLEYLKILKKQAKEN
ncbi:MAG: hypothetical protein PHV82_08870 [Victivallaceae bacterium]|nr:hypothetical protein [Victivallaceae bacterium]